VLEGKRFVFNGAELSDIWQELKGVQQRCIQNAGALRKQKSLRRLITGAAKKSTFLGLTNSDAQEASVVL